MKPFTRNSSQKDWDATVARMAKEKEERLRRLAGHDAIVRRVSELLFEADPVGINFEENTDEYDMEAEMIVVRLLEGLTPATILPALHEIFVACFDDSSGPADRYQNVSVRIWEAWREYSDGNP